MLRGGTEVAVKVLNDIGELAGFEDEVRVLSLSMGNLLPHLGWIAARAPNRVNRAHGPTKENSQNLYIFSIFPAHTKNWPRGPQMGPRGFFATNPDLADILGRTDFDFENFYFFDFLGPKFLAWAHLGPAWAHPHGPGLGPPSWAPRGPTHLGPAWAHPLGLLGWAPRGPLG